MKDGDRQKWLTAFVFSPLVLVVIFMMTAVASIFAQTATAGNIAGTVSDQSAAVVSGIPIILKNLDTGGSTSTTTAAQGAYTLSLLPPGRYSVSVNAAGFRGLVKNATVALGTGNTVNLQPVAGLKGRGSKERPIL